MSHIPPELPKAVVAVIEHDGRYLLVRRAKTARNPGWWCLPGGAIEPEEVEESAVCREVREELGINVIPLKRIWTTTSADGGWCTYWWKSSTKDTHVSPASREISEVRWCTRREATSLDPIFHTDRRFFEEILPRVNGLS